MLEGEGAGLAARVAELEVRCARQAEELLCLRSTLADALRRLNALEGRAPSAPTTQRNGSYTGKNITLFQIRQARCFAYESHLWLLYTKCLQAEHSVLQLLRENGSSLTNALGRLKSQQQTHLKNVPKET